MDDHTGTLRDHGRHKRAIQTYRREQVLIHRLVPFVVVKHGEATRRCRGTANHMHEDVDAAKTITDRIGDHGAACGGGDVGRDELVSTVAPAPRSAATTASPIPLVPPVTSARLPLSSR